ncbi:MAG: UbiA family prenyltransferase, partial [Pseudomonadota bacterium]
MSETPLSLDHAPQSALAGPRDYYRLLKPRVMSLVIFTAFVGMMMAPAPINPALGAIALFAIAVGAGASGALNMWFDADIDRQMKRTANRPIPAGT